jgi:hypothetical protein
VKSTSSTSSRNASKLLKIAFQSMNATCEPLTSCYQSSALSEAHFLDAMKSRAPDSLIWLAEQTSRNPAQSHSLPPSRAT